MSYIKAENFSQPIPNTILQSKQFTFPSGGVGGSGSGGNTYNFISGVSNIQFYYFEIPSPGQFNSKEFTYNVVNTGRLMYFLIVDTNPSYIISQGGSVRIYFNNVQSNAVAYYPFVNLSGFSQDIYSGNVNGKIEIITNNTNLIDFEIKLFLAQV